MNNGYYICARIINDKVSLIYLFFYIENNSFFTNYLALISTFSLKDEENVSKIVLYDTPQRNIKLLCLKQSQIIKCRFYITFYDDKKNQLNCLY